MSIVVKPYTFSAGAIIVAAEHNSNFDTLYNDYNGNITNANVSQSFVIPGIWTVISDYADDLTIAINTIGSTQTLLIINKAITLTSSDIVPSNICLWIVEGGSIIRAGGFTLTINGPFEAGLYQVFSGFTSGVTFGHSAIKMAIPQWWGATGNGTTDDTIAIKAAIASLPIADGTAGDIAHGQPGGIIFLPQGKYKITSVLGLYEGMFLKGAGMLATEIYNASTSGSDDAINLSNKGRSAIEYFGGVSDLCIRGNVSSGLGIYLNGLAYCHFENLLITENGTDGIRIDGTIGGSWKNIYSYGNYNDGLNIPITYSTTVQNFDTCQFRANANNGVLWGGISGYMNNCLIESNASKGIIVTNTYNNFTNLYCENNNGGGSGAVELEVTSYGNVFTGTYLANGVIHISSTGTYNQFFTSCLSMANPNFVIDSGAIYNEILFTKPINALNFYNHGGVTNVVLNAGKDIFPKTDGTYYVGNQASLPYMGYAGLVLKDAGNGKHYLIRMVSGVFTETALD